MLVSFLIPVGKASWVFEARPDIVQGCHVFTLLPTTQTTTDSLVSIDLRKWYRVCARRAAENDEAIFVVPKVGGAGVS